MTDITEDIIEPNEPPREHLFYTEGGTFHSYLKKAKKINEYPGYHKLQFESKVEFMKKDAPQIKPKVSVVLKRLDDCMKFKEEGNALFKANSPAEAKNMYTKAMMYYPMNKDDLTKNKDYAVILANRSAALENMNCFEAVMQDVDLAFKYGYPKELFFKVYNRKGNAQFKRKQYNDAKNSFDECKNYIGKSDMKQNERDRWRIKMAKQMSVFNSAKKGYENQQFPERPWTQQVEKDSVVEIHENNLKTTKEINVEEILHTETPFAAVLMDDAEGKICPHTLRRMPSGMPCPFGSKALFSSEEIRDEASANYHKHEYKTYEAWSELGLSPYAKLAFRLFTMIPKEQIPEIIDGLNLNFNSDDNTGANKFEYVFNLPVDKPQNGDNLTFAYLVTFMLSCLEEHNYFDNNKVTHEDAIILLYKSIQIVAKYAQKLTFGDPPSNEMDLWLMKQYPTKCFALALYPKFAYFKANSKPKDVGPDVILFFQDQKILVQSLRKLKEGQAVDIHWENQTKIPQGFQDMVNFKCGEKTCTISFPLTEKTNEKMIKCPLENCGAETNIWKCLKRIVELKQDHLNARKEAEKKVLRTAIHFLTDIIADLESFVDRPYRFMSTLEQDLKYLMLHNNETMEREWIYATR